jgi:hypothetical protein
MIDEKITGYVYPDERSKFQQGGKNVIIYKNRIEGTVPMMYSKINVWIKEHPNFWIVERK